MAEELSPEIKEKLDRFTALEAEAAAKAAEIEAMKAKLVEVDSLKEMNQKLSSVIETTFDPKNFFANENEMRRQALLKQYPNYNPNVISRIMDESLKNDEKIVYGLMLDGVADNESDARAWMESEFGEVSDMTAAQKVALNRLAKTYEEKFNNLKKIELPKFDPTKAMEETFATAKQAKQQKRSELESYIDNELLPKLSDLNVNGIKIDTTDVVQKLKTQKTNFADIYAGANTSEIESDIIARVVHKNMDSILVEHARLVEARVRAEIENPTPLGGAIPPPNNNPSYDSFYKKLDQYKV